MAFPTPNKRDVRASVELWIQDRVSGVSFNVPGAPWSTKAARIIVQPMLTDWNPEATHHDAAPYVTGSYRMEVFVQPAVAANPGQYRLDELEAATDDLEAVLKGKAVPVFEVDAHLAAGGEAGELSAAIGAADTAALVVGGAAFQEVTKELVIGGERVTWTTKTPAAADATFSGLTRAVGRTLAIAHPAGIPVADAPGSATGFADFHEPDTSILGWDVAVQRLRGLIQIPFAVSYVAV